jgi:hypothetical protein
MKNFNFLANLSLFTALTATGFASSPEKPDEGEPSKSTPVIDWKAIRLAREARQAALNPQASVVSTSNAPTSTSNALAEVIPEIPFIASTTTTTTTSSLPLAENDETQGEESEEPENVRAPIPPMRDRVMGNLLEEELNAVLSNEGQSDEELARAIYEQEQLLVALLPPKPQPMTDPQPPASSPLQSAMPQPSAPMSSFVSPGDSDEELAEKLQAEDLMKSAMERLTWVMEKQKFTSPNALSQNSNVNNPWLVEKVSAVMKINYGEVPLTLENLNFLSEIVTADINVGRTGHNIIPTEAVKAILSNQLNS